MIVALRNGKANASSHGMRMRLFTFLVAFAVLWAGTGGPSLACVVEGPVNVLVAVDTIDQATPGNEDDTDRRSNPPGHAVGHHHCCTATNAVDKPFAVLPSLEAAPVIPSSAAALTSFAQAPPVQPPAA